MLVWVAVDVASVDGGRGEGGREIEDLSTCSKSIIITSEARMMTMGQLEAGDWKVALGTWRIPCG